MLGEVVLAEVEKRGGKGFICGTPVISDGETMGWNGMKYSLVSRDWIADCVEMMAEAYAAVRTIYNVIFHICQVAVNPEVMCVHVFFCRMLLYHWVDVTRRYQVLPCLLLGSTL